MKQWPGCIVIIKIKALTKIVLVILSIQQGCAHASVTESAFDATIILFKQVEEWLGLGKPGYKQLAQADNFPSPPYPKNYNRGLEPIVKAYYSAFVRTSEYLGCPACFNPEEGIKILREGFSVWLPKDEKITKHVNDYASLIIYAAHTADTSRLKLFFSTIFKERYTDYVTALEKTADYMIPARLVESKIVKPLEAVFDPKLSNICKKHEIKKLLKNYKKILDREISDKYRRDRYLPVLEKALQREFHSIVKRASRRIRKEYKVDGLWEIYKDLQKPFGSIKLIRNDEKAVTIEFPAVCDHSIQFTFYNNEYFYPKIAMVVEKDGSAIVTPNLNKMLLEN